MDILEKLFGNATKVRIMKLFLFHSTRIFDIEEIKKRTQQSLVKVRKELNLLEKIGFLKKKKLPLSKVSGKKTKEKTYGWYLDLDFPYVNHLQGMLIHTNPFANKEILKKFKNLGDLKLLIISGIFIQNWESRVDLLIVGEKLKKSGLNSAIKTLEADMGCELRYTVLESEDFNYRMNMYDKLIRDVLDFPHKKVLNKLDI
jgi:hypothetical protein